MFQPTTGRITTATILVTNIITTRIGITGITTIITTVIGIVGSTVEFDESYEPLPRRLRSGNNRRKFATLGQSVESGRFRGQVSAG